MVTEMFVLVMYIFASGTSSGVTLHSIAGFSTEESCVREGKLGNLLVKDTTKQYRFVCMRQEFRTQEEEQ